MKELINQFLNKFAVKVASDEDSATTELYMDDHDCIDFNEQQYYIPQNNSSYTEDDELLREFLNYTYGL